MTERAEDGCSREDPLRPKRCGEGTTPDNFVQSCCFRTECCFIRYCTHRLGTAEVTRGLGVSRSVASRRLPRDLEVSYAGHTGALRSIPLSIRIRGMELGFLVRFGIVESEFFGSDVLFTKACALKVKGDKDLTLKFMRKS